MIWEVYNYEELVPYKEKHVKDMLLYFFLMIINFMFNLWQPSASAIGPIDTKIGLVIFHSRVGGCSHMLRRQGYGFYPAISVLERVGFLGDKCVLEGVYGFSKNSCKRGYLCKRGYYFYSARFRRYAPVFLVYSTFWTSEIVSIKDFKG